MFPNFSAFMPCCFIKKARVNTIPTNRMIASASIMEPFKTAIDF
jgi:hypothetical protein